MIILLSFSHPKCFLSTQKAILERERYHGDWIGAVGKSKRDSF